ncbi:MAG: COX15/CtaA family protein [Sphingomonadaceae bacterium]
MQTPAISPVRPASARPRALAIWLLSVAALVFVMIVVGGITRLTESGLSITEWKPVTGVIPPLNDAEWQEAFDKYREIPEYQQLKRGMSMAEFKFIFFWEWVHRLLGRVIGVAFAAPLLWFAARRAIPAGYGWRLTALFSLGALQGAIGWWMVQSGLSVRTDVSHFRLAVHLLTALAILGGLVWTALDLLALHRNPRARPARLTRTATITFGILFIQLLFGAWVAGLGAGYVSNTWPSMNDQFFPAGINWEGFSTFANDPFLTHFIHRWWAWVTVFALILLSRRARTAGNVVASRALHSAFGTQILLGIGTVVFNMNIVLAVLHQAVGALVVAATIWAAHAVGNRTVS